MHRWLFRCPQWRQMVQYHGPYVRLLANSDASTWTRQCSPQVTASMNSKWCHFGYPTHQRLSRGSSKASSEDCGGKNAWFTWKISLWPDGRWQNFLSTWTMYSSGCKLLGWSSRHRSVHSPGKVQIFRTRCLRELSSYGSREGTACEGLCCSHVAKGSQSPLQGKARLLC